MHSRFYVLRITRWRDARPSGARRQGGQALVDSPSHPSEPSFPTRSFHVKHERTDRSMRMVFDMRPGRLAALAFVLAALVLRRRRLWHRAAATGIGTRPFHVKQVSIVHSRSRAPCSCRARAVSGVCQYIRPALTLTTRPTRNETQNTPRSPLLTLTPTRPRSTFIPVGKEHGPPTMYRRPGPHARGPRPAHGDHLPLDHPVHALRGVPRSPSAPAPRRPLWRRRPLDPDAAR